MADNLPAPESRVESYLAKAAGEDVTIPEKPLSRLEQYLNAIAEGGGGGGGGTYTAGDGIDITNDTISVDTNTIQEKLTAGTGIDITDNTISATGGGGEVTHLTTASYDFPVEGADGIALWLLDEGEYIFDANLKVYKMQNSSATWLVSSYLKVIKKSNTAVHYDSDSGKWSDIWMNSSGYSYSENVFMYGSLVQSTGTSVANVMSQNATSSMVFDDPAAQVNIKIGDRSSVISPNGCVTIGERAAGGRDAVTIGSQTAGGASGSVAIGHSATGTSNSVAIGYLASSGNRSESVAIGHSASTGSAHPGSVALGAYAVCTRTGEVYIGSSNTSYGYDSTAYRILGGVHDGVDAHDATTVGQVNTRLGGLTLLPITQAAYDALATKDANTLYVITGA